MNRSLIEAPMLKLNPLVFVFSTFLLSVSAVNSRAEQATPEALVDALAAVFGKHEGFRSGHANGICVRGSFVPSADAKTLTSAMHFSSDGPWPVVGRFSMGGGNPTAPHTQKDNARGLALHFDLGKGVTTDMVLLSAPVFVAKDPDQFLELLQTVASGDKEKIGAYFKANPESTNQGAWLNARPVPASYASVNYYSVHTFTLVAPSGDKTLIKWKLVPAKGEEGLSDEEVKAKSSDFYDPELKARLANGPAEFTLLAIVGLSGDEEANPTVLWPDDRKATAMGTLKIIAIEDNGTCDSGIFDPTNVTAGIEGPKNDGIYQMRSPAYAVSFSRRAK